MLAARRMTFKGIQGALAWRLRAVVGDQSIDRAFVTMARAWRPLIARSTFIGISGSAGKTTTKELLVSMLSQNLKGTGNPDSLNALPEVAKTLLRVSPTHDFCVAELSEDRPGALDAALALFAPSIGIVTVLGNDHLGAFESLDDIAKEVTKLAISLPADGTAVLNADDQQVLSMAADCKCKVITFGTSSSADLQASEVQSNWPDRLQFTLQYGTDQLTVQTALCGEHWLPSVLGAIGGGLAMGLSLEDCAEGLRSVEPYEGRMQPVFEPEGITFIRDDFKAPLWTVESSFAFMRNAKAARKIIVMGTLSDCGSKTSKKYFDVAVKAQAIADHTIFVGPKATSVLKVPRLDNKPPILAFGSAHEASAHLNGLMQEGDLVLLKGSSKEDHLVRIILALAGEIGCWRVDCKRTLFCTACPDIARQSRPASASVPAVLTVPFSDESRSQYPAIFPDTQIVIGLGNPNPIYAETPHNIGHKVVDKLAENLQLYWIETPEAWLAYDKSRRESVCLVKVKQPMNLTGHGLKKLTDYMQFSPQQCIMVFDDVALPLGTVRTKMSGSAGGHRGVASILEMFQTDKIRRVKVGVNQANSGLEKIEYLLRKFDKPSSEEVDRVIPLAQSRCLEMVNKASKASRTNSII